MGWKKKKAVRKKQAEERINELLILSEKHSSDPILSSNAIKTAVAISKRHKIRIPSRYKRKFCKGCYTLFIPNKTVRIRIGEGKISMTCLICGKVKRIPYLKEKREIKRKSN